MAIPIACLALSFSSAEAMTSVRLAWERSPDPAAIGYIVHYDAPLIGITNVLDVGDADSATLNNLIESATYQITVTAYNSARIESDPSNLVTYQVPEAVYYSLKIGAFTNGLVEVSPKETAGAVAEKYLSGAIVKVAATPDRGWLFSGWNVNGQTIFTNPLLLTINATTTVTPKFKAASSGFSGDSLPGAMQISLGNGKLSLTIPGDLGAWVAESSNNFSAWIPVATGLTSQQLTVEPTNPCAFYRLRSLAF
jgi:hypothetical protein